MSLRLRFFLLSPPPGGGGGGVGGVGMRRMSEEGGSGRSFSLARLWSECGTEHRYQIDELIQICQKDRPPVVDTSGVPSIRDHYKLDAEFDRTVTDCQTLASDCIKKGAEMMVESTKTLLAEFEPTALGGSDNNESWKAKVDNAADVHQVTEAAKSTLLTINMPTFTKQCTDLEKSVSKTSAFIHKYKDMPFNGFDLSPELAWLEQVVEVVRAGRITIAEFTFLDPAVTREKVSKELKLLKSCGASPSKLHPALHARAQQILADQK
eukprot:215072-Pyramimonas_sp.AAC.1